MVIFIGIQASGKSTFHHDFLKPLGYAHINLDTLRTRDRERNALLNCLREGIPVVIDNTNPELADRQRYIPLAREYGYEVIGIFFQSKLLDCMERNSLRENSVPKLAIPYTQKRLQMPAFDEGFDLLFFAKITDKGFDISPWT